jgi:hypothetical protein
MTIEETITLVMTNSDVCPYRGKLPKEVALEHSIDLAKLCLDFAENGMADEAMNLDVNHWKTVISELESKRSEL